MGRPKKWDELDMPSKLILVEGWARDGLTDEQVSHNLGISTTLLYEWKNEYSEFADALKKGKEISDYMVENALFKRALGYTFEETTYEAVRIGDGEPSNAMKIKTVVKEVAADTTAQIYWLKNRKPEKWRDKPDSDEKLKKLIALLSKLNLSEEDINELVKEVDSV